MKLEKIQRVTMNRDDEKKQIVFQFNNEKDMNFWQEQFYLGEHLIWEFKSFQACEDLSEFEGIHVEEPKE